MSENTRIRGHAGFFRAGRRGTQCLSLAVTVAFTFLGSPLAHAQGDGRSGKDVVDAVCVQCHGTGIDGAPKIGDREAWSNRAAQGLSSLTLHAIEGIRKMPAHGGNPELSPLEIARAVTYMVNRAGGTWVEPMSVSDLSVERSGEQVVKAQCIKCHGEGVGGAPKIGDLEAWVPRIRLGLAYAIRSAIHGHGGMPPRGGMANLTDTEIRSAILYMFNPAAASAARSPAAATPQAGGGEDPNHRTVGGIDIYLGFIPVENLQALPEGSPERAMHGGIPRGSGYYHINVSLFDETSRTPVDGARVQLQLEAPGRTSTITQLEPMAIGAGSYGNYVRPEPGTRYRIGLRIRKPGASAATVEASFEHEFE